MGAAGLNAAAALFLVSAVVWAGVAVAAGYTWMLYVALPLGSVAILHALFAIGSGSPFGVPVTVATYMVYALAQLYGAEWLASKDLGRWTRPLHVWGAVTLALVLAFSQTAGNLRFGSAGPTGAIAWFIGAGVVAHLAWLHRRPSYLHGAFALLAVALVTSLAWLVPGVSPDAPEMVATFLTLALAQIYGAHWLETRAQRTWAEPMVAWGSVTLALVLLATAPFEAYRFGRVGPTSILTWLVGTAVVFHFAWLHRRPWYLHGAFALLTVSLLTSLAWLIPGVRLDGTATVVTFLALSLAQIYGAHWLETRDERAWATPIFAWGRVMFALILLASGPFGVFRFGVRPGPTAVFTWLVGTSVVFHFAWLHRRPWYLHVAFPLLSATMLMSLVWLVPGFRFDAPETIATFVALSLVQVYGARWLEIRGQQSWAAPAFIWGAITMAASFITSLVSMLWVSVWVGVWLRPHAGLDSRSLTFLSLSIVYAATFLHLAWMNRHGLGWLARFGTDVPAYLGLTLLTGAFAWGAFDSSAGGFHLAILSVWFLAGSLIGRVLTGDLQAVYGRSLRRISAVTVWLPLILALGADSFLPLASTYVLGALLYGIEGWLDGSRPKGYVAGILAAVAYAAVLQWQGIQEPQAYVFPYGLAVLYVAHLERPDAGYGTIAGRLQVSERTLYQALTWVGLALLYGVSVAQSMQANGAPYLALALVEAVLGLFWGLRQQSRSWVMLSAFCLVAEAVLQLFETVIALPAWVLLGAAGGILLTGGVLALAKRQEILALREAAVEEWDAWKA